MISLSILELLYIVLIISIVVLTGYAVVVLSELNGVLRDARQVSTLAAKLAKATDGVTNKAMAAMTGAIKHFGSKFDQDK